MRLNPFNTDARVMAFTRLLADAGGSAADGASARDIATRGIMFSPGDARAYSLMGELARREGVSGLEEKKSRG